MAGSSTPASLLRAYERDLREVLDHALDRLEDGTVDEGMLSKLCLESARLVAYERASLLPVLRDVPDGAELSRVEGERLETLLAAARAVESTPPDGPVRDVLHALASAADDLARHQVEQTFPLVDSAVPQEALEAIAAGVTPTMQSGPTHSHPTSMTKFDAAGWPRPGFTDAAYDAFLAESADRTS